MTDEGLKNLIQFLANISLLILAMSSVAALFFMMKFGTGVSKLGGTSTMYDRPPEPKQVVWYLVGSVLFGGFSYMLGVSYFTVFEESAFINTPVWAYADTAPSGSNNADYVALMVRSTCQVISMVFLYSSFLSAIDAGASDGRERGALSKGIMKLIGSVAFWNPDKVLLTFDFVPYFDVISQVLSGSVTGS